MRRLAGVLKLLPGLGLAAALAMAVTFEIGRAHV